MQVFEEFRRGRGAKGGPDLTIRSPEEYLLVIRPEARPCARDNYTGRP